MLLAASLRRVITWSAIFGYALVVSGLPLPLGIEQPVSSAASMRLAAKDRSTPFPCMDKPCGCATAEQCFTSCCCHTPAETLAWARAHEVDAAVITTLQRRVAAVSERPEPSCCEATSCCAEKTCGAEKTCAVETSCCEAAAVPPVGDDPAEPSEETESSRSISLRAMLACGGIVAEWFSCGGSLPPPHVALVTGLDLIELLPCFNDSASSLRSAPDAPPPRVG